MAKKRQSIENKLGNWAEQATLTRATVDDKSADSATRPSNAARTTYPVERSLLTRLAEVAAAHNMSQNELIGYLLTWSLDQVESGAHQLEHREQAPQRDG